MPAAVSGALAVPRNQLFRPHSGDLARTSMTRQSGLQKEVLALYRRALRMLRTKPPDARAKFSLFVRYTFHTQASLVPPRNISAVEHLLRRGKRQVELYENPSIKDCHISQAMKDWEQCHSKRYKISTPS